MICGDFDDHTLLDFFRLLAPHSGAHRIGSYRDFHPIHPLIAFEHTVYTEAFKPVYTKAFKPVYTKAFKLVYTQALKLVYKEAFKPVFTKAF